jgi:hypothetical protein
MDCFASWRVEASAHFADLLECPALAYSKSEDCSIEFHNKEDCTHAKPHTFAHSTADHSTAEARQDHSADRSGHQLPDSLGCEIAGAASP